MNILIRGYLDRNLGDDLMIRIVCRQLSGHVFYMEAAKKELLLPFASVENLHDLADFPDVKIHRILRVTGSGFMIRSKTALVYALKELLFSKNSRLPLCTIGCNIGPFQGRLARWAGIRQIRKNSLVTVRDAYSFEFLQRHGKGIKGFHFPDIVFGLPQQWIPEKTGEGCLGISAYRRGDTDNLSCYRKLAAVADDFLSRTDQKVLLFAFDMELENDLAAAITIRELCKEKDRVEIVAHKDNGAHVLSNLARCGKLVTVRFHSAVLSIRMGIPFVPVIYSKKTDQMLDDLGYQGVRYEIDTFDPAAVSASLETAQVFSVASAVFERARMHAGVFEKEMLCV